MAEPKLRQEAPRAALEEAHVPDRVFTHDLVLDIEIGVHHYEKGATQRVRFSVDVDLTPTSHALDDDISRTFDYAVIGGGLSLLVVETLAEEVARHCFAHPRAARVVVKIEKLDKEPGAVGVEIVRTKGNL